MIAGPELLIAVAALLGERPAHGESCTLQSASPPGQWKFVRAYDPETGSIVLQQAVNGGDSKPVTVSGERVKVEYKLPGQTRYQPAVVSPCKGGNTVRT